MGGGFPGFTYQVPETKVEVMKVSIPAKSSPLFNNWSIAMPTSYMDTIKDLSLATAVWYNT